MKNSTGTNRERRDIRLAPASQGNLNWEMQPKDLNSLKTFGGKFQSFTVGMKAETLTTV
jgi:hypothetical protein